MSLKLLKDPMEDREALAQRLECYAQEAREGTIIGFSGIWFEPNGGYRVSNPAYEVSRFYMAGLHMACAKKALDDE